MEINQTNVDLSPMPMQHQNSDTTKLLYNKNDTFLILIKKNETLCKLLAQANTQIEETGRKYTQLEAKSQRDKASILKQLDQIAVTYKTYAESHKILQLAEQKAKELLDNNIALAHRVSLLQSTNISTQNLINDLYQLIMNHSLDDDSGKFIGLLRSYMNEKFKVIREEIAIKDNSRSLNQNEQDLFRKVSQKKDNSHQNSNNSHRLNQTAVAKSRKNSPSNQMIYVKSNTRPITPKIGSLNDKREMGGTSMTPAFSSNTSQAKFKSLKRNGGSRTDLHSATNSMFHLRNRLQGNRKK